MLVSAPLFVLVSGISHVSAVQIKAWYKRLSTKRPLEIFLENHHISGAGGTGSFQVHIIFSGEECQSRLRIINKPSLLQLAHRDH